MGIRKEVVSRVDKDSQYDIRFETHALQFHPSEFSTVTGALIICVRLVLLLLLLPRDMRPPVRNAG